jgi:hypothetical protein
VLPIFQYCYSCLKVNAFDDQIKHETHRRLIDFEPGFCKPGTIYASTGMSSKKQHLLTRALMSRTRVFDFMLRLERADYVSLVLIGLALVAAWTLTYLTDGTHRAFPHTFYIPVLYAAYRFGIPGGVLTGALAMFVCGRILPLTTAEQIPQTAANSASSRVLLHHEWRSRR